MALTTAHPSVSADLRTGALLFHGLADRNRLAIVRLLASGEQRVVDLTKHLELAQGTVSGHLACLRDCGLVTSRAQGRSSMWSLTAAPETMAILAATEALLAATGDAVALCPRYGTDGAQ